MQPDPDTWIAGLGTLPLIAQPGERWLYNTGASVLGVLLARATGQPFAEVLRTRVFEPLGMRDTASGRETDRLATAYRPAPGRTRRVGRARRDVEPAAGVRGRRAAGLVSTVDDLLAFARMLLAGGAPVLSRGGARDDERPAHRRSEGARRARPQLLRGQVVVVLPGGVTAARSVGTAASGSSWLVDPTRRADGDRAHAADVREPELPEVHRDIQAAALAE